MERTRNKYDQHQAVTLDKIDKFHLTDTFTELVKKLLFHPGKRIMRIDEETGKLVSIITLSDLFNFFVTELDDKYKK